MIIADPAAAKRKIKPLKNTITPATKYNKAKIITEAVFSAMDLKTNFPI